MTAVVRGFMASVVPVGTEKLNSIPSHLLFSRNLSLLLFMRLFYCSPAVQRLS